MKQCVCLLFVLFAGLAAAQFVAQPQLGLRADLSVEVTATGEETATLTGPATLPPELGPALARAFGCQPGDLQPEPYAGRMKVRCSMVRSTSTGLHTRIDLRDLKERLGLVGVKQLQLVFMFSKLGDVTVSPAIASGRHYRIVSLPLGEVPAEITIDAGIDQAHIRVFEAGIVGLLLLPFALLLAKPRTLIHLIATTQTLFLIGWAGWTWVLLETRAWTLCELIWRNAYTGPLLLLGTSLASVWIGSRLAAMHYARLAPPGANVVLFRQAKFSIGSIVVFLFTMIFGIFASDDIGPFAGFGIGIGGALLFIVRLRIASRGGSYPLAGGELRDRIFQLAASAGVRIRSVTILKGAETRPPAAFATRWGGILLTDGLLKHLSKREIDAIVCHEFSHAAPKSRATMWVLYGIVISTTMAAQFVPGTVMLFPWLIVATVVGFKAWRRSEELAADRDSVRWSRDPEAMISGLARVSLASGLPLDWGAPMSWMLSHPSTGRRLQLIAAAGGVPESRVAELIEYARSEPGDHYEESNAIPEDAAFSPVLKQRLSTRLGWYALAAPVVLGVGIAWALEKTGLDSFAVLAIGMPASMVAFYLGYERIVGKGRDIARCRALAKNGPGIFVGFSPSAEVRIYDGMYHYDFGLVRFSPGALEFVGDRTRFTLDSRFVKRVWLGDGPRHWTPRKIVCVEYCGSDETTSTVFSLQSFEAHIWPWTAVAARKLYEHVETWRGQHVETLPPSLPCDIPRVAGAPDSSARLSAVLKSVTIYAGVGLTVTSVFGMANLERGFDWAPMLLCGALAMFVALPRLMKPRQSSSR